VERIDESDPQAAERLHDLATQFSIMAAEVRSRPAPVVAAEANTMLADTFDAYAEAFELAAAGVGTTEDDALSRAIARLEEAGSGHTAAVSLVVDAAAECGLESPALASS
jgi:hypothetical protein